MLKLENIKKSFVQPDKQRVPILDIPNFEIATGEQVVLIGPSGCGKTTLLHTIAGITKPDSGKVLLDQIELTRFRSRFGIEFAPINLVTFFKRSICSPGFRLTKMFCLG